MSGQSRRTERSQAQVPGADEDFHASCSVRVCADATDWGVRFDSRERKVSARSLAPPTQLGKATPTSTSVHIPIQHHVSPIPHPQHPSPKGQIHDRRLSGTSPSSLERRPFTRTIKEKKRAHPPTPRFPIENLSRRGSQPFCSPGGTPHSTMVRSFARDLTRKRRPAALPSHPF